ncbi:hypothetical protein ABH925_007432 [Streptacidiphilus sp. EB129]
MEAAPAGLTFPQLMSVCELSRHQVRSGLGALRDIRAERGRPPVLLNRGKGYRFSADADEPEAWERAWVGVKTSARREGAYAGREQPLRAEAHRLGAPASGSAATWSGGLRSGPA